MSLIISLIFQQGDPPDLDEMFKRFMRKLRKPSPNMDAFRSNGNGSSGGPGLPAASVPILILLIGAVIIGGSLISGFYTVDQSERGVTFRFGKPLSVTQPGLRWVVPFIEDYRIVNLTGVRTIEIGYRGGQRNKVARESLMLTDNLNIIDLQFAVQYLLKNPEDFLYNNRNPDEAVLQVAETAMREVVGGSNIDFVLYEGREEIASETLNLMQDILDRYQTGILIQQVAIQNVQPPDQVQDAFEDAIRARQDRERKINEGEAYANNVVPQARGQSARILEEAEGYRRSRIVIAEGAGQRFEQLVAEYDKAPRVTRQRLYLDALEGVLSSTSKIIVDQGEGSQSLIYLPLDRLLENRAAKSNAPNDSNSTITLTSPSDTAEPATGRLSLEEIRNEVRRRLNN